MNRIILFLIAVLLVNSSVFAQDSSEFVNTKQIGLTLSSVSGAGIQYIYPYNERDNIKFVGIYIYNNDNNNNRKDSFFSLGVEYQRDLRESEIQRVYTFAGTSIDNSFSEETFFDSDGQQDNFFSLGAGMGIDLGDRARGLIFNGHVAYQFTRGFGDEDKTRIGLGVGVGIGFNF